jgi:CubicO group peptidase (beta-lactamase class C family)
MTIKSSTTMGDDITTEPMSGAYGESETGMNGGQHPLAEAGQEATQSVGMLAERATGLGFQQADKARTTAADGIEQVTESIRRVSMDLESEQPQIASVVTTAADQAERVAEYLRTTDARQILSTVEDVARRQPLIFLGGAFVLGLAASRLLKAAGGQTSSTGSYGMASQRMAGQQWSGGGYEATGPGAIGTNGFSDTRIDEGI